MSKRSIHIPLEDYGRNDARSEIENFLFREAKQASSHDPGYNFILMVSGSSNLTGDIRQNNILKQGNIFLLSFDVFYLIIK